MTLLYCAIASIIGLLAGAVAHYVFSKPPDPHEVAVGRVVLQYLSIKSKDFPTDYYRANFKSYLMGDGRLLDATADTLPKVLYVLFDHLFGVFRSRGKQVQRLERELAASQRRADYLRRHLSNMNRKYNRVSSDLAIYEAQGEKRDDKLFAHAEQIESLARVMQEDLG